MITKKERPETLKGVTIKVKVAYDNLYLTINELDGEPFEIFCVYGKSGLDMTAQTEGIGRLVSLALRSGISVSEIVKQLKHIGGETPIPQKGWVILSIPDAIAKVLESRYLKTDTIKPKDEREGKNGN